MWRIVTMSELYDFMDKETSSIYIKPTFPTRRWGQVHLKESTTDKEVLDRAILKYKEMGIKARKKKDIENAQKFKNMGILYKLEIFEKIIE